MEIVGPSDRLSLFLTDGRNIIIFFLSITVFILSVFLAIDVTVRVRTPSPYLLLSDFSRYHEQLKAYTDESLQELRNRMTEEQNNQILINRDFSDQINSLQANVTSLPGNSPLPLTNSNRRR